MLSLKDALGALGSDGSIDMQRIQPMPQTMDLTPTKAGQTTAQSSPTRAWNEDDMSDDEAPLSTVVPDSPSAQGAAPAAAAPSLSAQVADCKTKIGQLQAWKQQRLQDEDYIGAHHVHQLIQEQEQKLQALRRQLDAMPTPARSGQGNGSETASGAAMSRPAKAPRVARNEATGMKRSSSSRECPGSSPSASARVARLEASPPPASRHGMPDVTPTAMSPAPASRQSCSVNHSPSSSPQPALDMQHDQGRADGEEEDDEMESAPGDISAEPEGQEEEAGSWRTMAGGLVELASDVPVPHPFRLPSETFDRLYGYQRSGVAWMARHWQKGQGCICADEMGLGKTVQVCAFLNGARKAGATHALLLLPVSLLHQWAREARRWCPGWPVYIFHGPSAAQKARALRRVSRPQGGILLASYGILSSSEDLFQVSVEDPPTPKRRGRKPGPKRRRLDDDDEPAEAEESEDEQQNGEVPPGGLTPEGTAKAWNVVVCDEAHKMKNISTLLGKSLRRLRADCRILLTGTPVQNALGDLWALLDFAQPGLLGNHATFVKRFSDPIDKGSVRGASPFQVQLKKHLSEQLRALLDPYVLRRTKKDAGLLGGAEDSAGGDAAEAAEEEREDESEAKKLPPKRETLIWLKPSEDQSTIYQKVLEKSDIIRQATEKGKLGIEVFRAIGMLKRLCNHPMLLLPTTKERDWASLLEDAKKSLTDAAATGSDVPADGDDPMADAAVEVCGAAADDDEDAEVGGTVEDILDKLPRSLEAVAAQSAKLRCLASLLPALAAKGHRTLLFSASVKMLDLVQVCCLKPHGLRCLRIDGQTDVTERSQKVDKFNREVSRFQFMLLTTKVGGVGLNLTSANRVVLVDPDWNPATDAQAVDRAFRIGQQREVRVYRLVMSGLIEDKMFRLQVFKMALSKTALEAEQQHRYFSNREIRALFEWCDPAEGETRKLLVKEHGENDESAVEKAAEEDGSANWLTAGPAVGLSDFNLLFNSVAKEEEPDDMCAAQVMEAQHKLGAADEKATRMAEARLEAIAHSETVAKDLEEANSTVELMKEKKAQAEEVVKERRRELQQAKRAEDAAQGRQDKAITAKAKAEDSHLKAKHGVSEAKEALDAAAKTVSDADAARRVAEEAFAKAMADTEAQLAIVKESGKAAGNGAVDVPVAKLRAAAKALDKIRTAVDIANTRQVELETVDKEVLRADEGVAEAEAAAAELEWNKSKSTNSQPGAEMQAALAKKSAELTVKNREREKKFAEQSQSKALQKLQTSREAVSTALEGMSEAWSAFVESFQKADGRQVTMDQVKKAQSAAKATARQLSSTWAMGKKVRDASTKTPAVQRKAAQKVAEATAKEVEAKRCFDEALRDFEEAGVDAKTKHALRVAAEQCLTEAEASRSAVEQEDMEVKKRRDHLKTQLPLAKEAIKAAKAAEKEAEVERRQLHTACSKVEQAARAMEEAANSAVSSLQAEEYDAKQVVQAYERSKSAKTDG